MSTKLSGFVAMPIGADRVVYLRLSSIDAVWPDKSRTLVQLRGCAELAEFFSTPLELKEVISLMSAAQDG